MAAASAAYVPFCHCKDDNDICCMHCIEGKLMYALNIDYADFAEALLI